MIPLAKTFRKDGFQFKQLKREGKIALFVKSKPPSEMEFYEVVVVQRHPERKMAGIVIRAGESMPSSESWGTHGWSRF